MISAVAARKASQATQRDSDAQGKSSQVSTTRYKVPDSYQKPTLKRKPSSQDASASKRKKVHSATHLKRQAHAPPKASRPFAENSFKNQEATMAVDSSDEESIVASEVTQVSGSPEDGEEWSSNASVNNSSDLEMDDDIYGVPVEPSSSSATTSEVVSTFQVSPNRNTFFLIPSGLDTRLGLEVESSRNITLVALQPEETICLLGTYTFSVIQGSVRICGATISSSTKIYRVFAPRSSPIPVLQAADCAGAIPTINLLPRDVQIGMPNDSVLVLLQELHTDVEGLGHICRTFHDVFTSPRLQKSAPTRDLKLNSVSLIQVQTKDVQVFELPISWERALPITALPSIENAPSVHIVKGPKNSGKSTFARALINSLLTVYQKVAYLECDLGQSEFTPGGMVALNILSSPLFGPPFTHPTLPYVAHYIGGTTPLSSPSHYLSAIQSMLETYRSDIQSPSIAGEVEEHNRTRILDAIPLVVNTMGWSKGLGADLTLRIQELAEPTNIYEFENLNNSLWPKIVDPLSNGDRMYNAPTPSSANLHRLLPAPVSFLSTNYTNVDHRTLSMMSYFHAVFPNPEPGSSLLQITALSWQTSLPLCAQPPYEVDCSQLFDKVILTGAGAEEVVLAEVGRVLNGAVVGLLACQSWALNDITPTLASHPPNNHVPMPIPYTPGFSPPSPAASSCLGLGLIRSVSPISPQIIHILTPVPSPLLSQVKVVVKGELELPIWGFLDFRGDENIAGVEKEEVPFLQWGKGEGLGSERRRVRRNLMRRGQM